MLALLLAHCLIALLIHGARMVKISAVDGRCGFPAQYGGLKI